LQAHIVSQLRKAGLPVGKKQLVLLLKTYRYPEQKLPLHIYASVGEVDHIALIIQHAVAENKNVSLIINAPDTQGRTPLHYACLGKHTEVVKLLLIHNASVTATDSNGKTARDIAQEMNFHEISRLFESFKN
jgi:ankyrin repeat protein